MASKPKRITITGDLGSGKTSVLGYLIRLLVGYRVIEIGQFLRDLANQLGLTLAEICKKAETDSTIDNRLDDMSRALNHEERVVVDGRVAFHFVDSFKVCLKVKPDVAARRALEHARTNEKRRKELGGASTVEEVVELFAQRMASDRRRYLEKYGIQDHTAEENFDLIIWTDTPMFDGKPEAVAACIKDGYDAWLEDRKARPLW